MPRNVATSPQADKNPPPKPSLADWLKFHWHANLKIPLAAILFGLLVGGLFTLFIGKNPLAVYGAILESFLGSPRNFMEVIGQATPLILTGLSIAFAFRTGMFNIGAEGQYIIGMLAAGIVGIKLDFLPGPLLIVLGIAAGALAGAIWAGIPGLLKAKRGVHEVINTIMMNYVALHLANTLILSNWLKEPGYQATWAIPKKMRLSKFLGTSANWGIILAILAAVLVYYILWHTNWAIRFVPRGIIQMQLHMPVSMYRNSS